MRKAFLYTTLLMFGCGANDITDRTPIFVPKPKPPSSFETELTQAIEKEMTNAPEDKQKHYTVSKGLFNVVPVQSQTTAGVLFEACMMALQVGYEKELRDRGVSSDVNWDIIYTELRKLDSQIAEAGLDEGDLFADWIGISEASIIYSMFGVQ